MSTNPLAFEYATYIDDDAAEQWSIDHTNSDLHDHRRRVFANEQDLIQFQTLIQESADILQTDKARSDALVREANQLMVEMQVSVGNSKDAIDFFAGSRANARREAHDLVAAVDPTLGNFEF